MDGSMTNIEEPKGLSSAFGSPTFGQDGSFRLDKPVGSASISPCGRDVVLASRQGLHIIDLDSPWSPPRHLAHHTPWEVADVQWSPFASRDYWVVSTSNQKALVWNLSKANANSSIEHVLHAHTRAITDINFSAHHLDILATCAVDSFVHCWDLRHPARPAITFCDWFAGATQVKWNRQDSHIVASSHDKFLRIWDDRKGAYPLRSIEAHATKIYGVDWNRLEPNNLVTCSLDRSIKFWNYTKDTDGPDRVIRTPFPVWRARHTPFGYGLLAMPQRGDHDLHLYDRRWEKVVDGTETVDPVCRFGGHNDQVKEFLWRPRGTVENDVDDREFQLVSWGTDRILRLHKVNQETLEDVGFAKGMKVKPTMNITRKNAIYKTFREDPSRQTDNEGSGLSSNTPHVSIRPTPTGVMSRVSVPFAGGYGGGGLMSSTVGKKTSGQKEMDPISWMRGVKIGKREPSPSDMHQSMSSILSPSVKTDPTWDVFDSLGEEITHVGDKFAKVTFDEIDMHRRKITISLSGPWGPDDTSMYIRSRIEFPISYPNSAAPAIALEKTASVSNDTLKKISSELEIIVASFASRQRNSLEFVLRYLLGERGLDESLQWLKKHRDSEDLDSVQDPAMSSSDEEDDDLGKYIGPQADGLEINDPILANSDAQYNVPLPRACGASWACNGRLVCFFPVKQEASILDQSLRASDRSSKNRMALFQGFGRLQNQYLGKKKGTSALETIESDDSDIDEYSSSSSGSSMSSVNVDLPRHHFMPIMAWRGGGLEAHPALVVEGSQKSSGENGTTQSNTSKSSMFVSVHDFNDLLASKKHLAQDYAIGSSSHVAAHNANVAREGGDLDLADVWSFIELLLHNKVPLEALRYADKTRSIMVMVRHALSPLRAKDSAVDLSFDLAEDKLHIDSWSPVKWGFHPLGRRGFVNSLIDHFEQLADIQMVAMLSCVLSESSNSARDIETDGPHAQSTTTPASDRLSTIPFKSNDYYPSSTVAKSLLQRARSGLSIQVDSQKVVSGPQSATFSTGAATSDRTAMSSGSGTPPYNRPLRSSTDLRDPHTASLSTSPEQLRNVHRSSSNLSGLATSFTRPFYFNSSAASSPPNSQLKKRPSPVGSYLGATPSGITWASSGFFARSSTITEDPRPVFSRSTSDTGEDVSAFAVKKSMFSTKVKNQDKFDNDGHVDVPLLDPNDEWKYRAYRESYANFLHMWDLPIARCEILKYNHPSGPAPYLDPIGKRPTTTNTRPDTKTTALSLTPHCATCSTPLPSHAPTNKCPSCIRPLAPPKCTLCNTLIHGLASPCFDCGHAMHSPCRSIILQTDLEECLSGCGCTCADHTALSMPEPELSPLLPLAKPGRNASPAPTLIGGVNEQEMAGWNEGRGEDVAYESLARNLGRGVRRGSARGRGAGVRQRASQIWRGGINL